jgi:hypothetical protein
MIAALDLTLGLVVLAAGGWLAVDLAADQPQETRAMWALSTIAALVIAGGLRLIAVGVWG